MRSQLVFSCLLFFLVAAGSPAATFESVGLYQSVDELYVWAEGFGQNNSDVVQVLVFGRSHEDRPLIALKLATDPLYNDRAKPEFLFTGGLHAREVVGSEAAYRLAEHLVRGYRNQDPAFLDVFAEREVWIVPNLNPDGRLRVEGGYSRQRKNMELYPGQNPDNFTRGVDLNRNFPHRWDDASSDARSETYRGPEVLSAPEASALWSMLHDPAYFNDLTAAIDIHSGTQAILAPWTSPSDFASNPLPPEDRAKFDFLANRMSEISSFTTDRLWYDAYGVLADSLYEEFGAYAFVEEIFEGPFTDYFTFFNPIDEPARNAAVDQTIDSAMFLLSDEAFEIVPEPSTLVLALLGLLSMVLLGPCRKRGPRSQNHKSPLAVSGRGFSHGEFH